MNGVEYIKTLKNKNIHIVGLSGAEGSAVAFFLADNGVKNITAHDFSENLEELKSNFFKTHLEWASLKREQEFKKLPALPIKINYKKIYLGGILEADLIFAPSSWRLYKFNFPKLKEAEEKGILFKGITNLYFDLAFCPIISVTGTKGKGTTSKLIYEILKKDKEKKGLGKAYYGGNDRYFGQALDNLLKMAKDDVLVLETSNRQLAMDFKKSPRIGVITNITPDHLKEHNGFEGYIKVKRKLIKYQKKGDYAVLNYDNETTRRFAKEFPETAFLFSRKIVLKEGAFVKNKRIYIRSKNREDEIGALSDIKVLGEHNIENVLAAASAAYLFGVNPETIKETISAFRGLRHRMEFIGEYGGVKFYDDLASTTPESTMAAINTIVNQKSPQDKIAGRAKIKNQKLFLVSGGDSKGGNYSELAGIILKKTDGLILLSGTGSEKLKCQMSNVKLQNNSKIQVMNKISFNSKGETGGFGIIEGNDLSEALDIIKKQTKTGDIVLISPACAHFQSRYIDNTGKSLKKLIRENFNLTSCVIASDSSVVR